MEEAHATFCDVKAGAPKLQESFGDMMEPIAWQSCNLSTDTHLGGAAFDGQSLQVHRLQCHLLRSCRCHDKCGKRVVSGIGLQGRVLVSTVEVGGRIIRTGLSGGSFGIDALSSALTDATIANISLLTVPFDRVSTGAERRGVDAAKSQIVERPLRRPAIIHRLCPYEVCRRVYPHKVYDLQWHTLFLNDGHGVVTGSPQPLPQVTGLMQICIRTSRRTITLTVTRSCTTRTIWTMLRGRG